MSTNYMSKYDELHKGDYLWSNNKDYKAVFQVLSPALWFPMRFGMSN